SFRKCRSLLLPIRNWPVVFKAPRVSAVGVLVLPREVADQVDLCLPIGSSVGTQHLVKPDWRLIDDIGMLPGFPGQVRLGFTSHKAPVDRADALFLGDRQYRVEGAAYRAGHVFGTDYRPIVFL